MLADVHTFQPILWYLPSKYGFQMHFNNNNSCFDSNCKHTRIQHIYVYCIYLKAFEQVLMSNKIE